MNLLSETPAQKLSEKLSQVDSLLASDGWKLFLVPEINRRLKIHADACCDSALKPKKRAEHIEAVALARALLVFPEQHGNELRRKLADETRKRSAS